MESSIEEENSSSYEEEIENKIKLMLIGDSYVGKTSLLTKYCKNEFKPTYITTIGIDFHLKYFKYKGKRIKIQIWDTTGQERYRTLARSTINSSEGFIFVYDITNRESFNNINNWVEQVKEIAPKNSKSIIFGNKSDLSKKRVIEINEGKNLAKKYNMKFFETSAKNGSNLNEGFSFLIKEIMDDIDAVKANRKETLQLVSKDNGKKVKKKCC